MPPAFNAPATGNKFGLLGRAVIAIGIAGLLFVVGLKYAWSRLDITVSEPKLVGGEIHGSFRLEHSLNGILSKGIGGACLIGDFAHLMTDADAFTKGVVKSACTLKSQCNPYLSPGQKPGPENAQNWEGYCIRDEIGQGTCWYKPWDDPYEGQVCETSGLHPTATTPPKPGGTPWPVGKNWLVPANDAFPVQAFYNRYTSGRPAHWRVSGRLIGTDPKTQINVFGDPVCISTGSEKCLLN